MFYCSRTGHTIFLLNIPLDVKITMQGQYRDKTSQLPKSRSRNAQHPWESLGLRLPLPGVIWVHTKWKCHKSSRPHKAGVLERQVSKWIPPPPPPRLRFLKDFYHCHQYVFQTRISGKSHFKNPSFNKLCDKLFPFFWWRTCTGRVFYRKRNHTRTNKEPDLMIFIISIKASKESQWLFSSTMYYLTQEVTQWCKTKTSGIKPNTMLSSALWWYFHCMDIQ